MPFSHQEKSQFYGHSVGRLAPSPSGRMHIGNLFSFMVAYINAHQNNGYLVLRIDDLDKQRCKPEFCDQMISDLHWFGFSWEGDIVFQSQRSDAYRKAFQTLQSLNVIYPCFCTRADLHALRAPHKGEEVVYPGTCRKLSENDRLERLENSVASYRLNVSEAPDIELIDLFQGEHIFNLPHDSGDFIVKRKDSAYAYQLATVVDDAYMGVTEVIRGIDLLPSSARQAYLQNLLGFEPVEYGHIPLLCNGEGRRLAKRDGNASLTNLIEQENMSPQQILGTLAFRCGLIDHNESVSLDDLVKHANLLYLKQKRTIVWS